MLKTILNLKGATELSKKQQTLIFGGGSGTCGYLSPSGMASCNVSQSTALQFLENNGGNWCCDSCRSNGGDSSYC